MRLITPFMITTWSGLVRSHDIKECQPIKGDWWIQEPELVEDNILDFCTQTRSSVVYNRETPNALRLRVEQLGKCEICQEPDPSELFECIRRFRGELLDGCQGNDEIHNPKNYKYGGTIITPEGLKLTLTPLHHKAKSVVCWVTKYALWHGFEIRGSNVPNEKMGTQGEGLQDNLNACGHMTEWNFEETPNQEHQWRVTGRLPLGRGVLGCVAKALVAVDASTDCHPMNREII